MNHVMKTYIERFYRRTEKLVGIRKAIAECRRCSGLNQPNTMSAPGFGDPCSPIMLVGQSLCTRCQLTQIPFTRGSGDLIDEVLIEEGLSKFDVFTTNVVHCHPSGNKPSLPGEIENCQDWLRKELAIVKPNIILTLGADARNSFRGMGMTMALKEGVRWFNTGFWVNPACSLHVGFYWLRHPASFLYSHADTTEWKNNFRRILDHVHTAKAERIK